MRNALFVMFHQSDALAPARALRRDLVLGVGGLLVLFLLVSVLSVRSVGHPVTRLMRAVRRIELPGHLPPLPSFGRNEVGELGVVDTTSRSLPAQVSGTATLVFIAMALSGLVLWWPRTQALWRERLRPRLSGKWKRAVFDGHNVLGVYGLLGLLIVALTGPVWSWRWYEAGVAYLLTGIDPQGKVQTI